MQSLKCYGVIIVMLVLLSTNLQATLQSTGDLPLLEFEENGTGWKVEFNFPASFFKISSCPNLVQKKNILEQVKKVQQRLLVFPNYCTVGELSAPTSELLSENCIMNENEKISVTWTASWNCKKTLTSLTVGPSFLNIQNNESLFRYILKKKSITQEGRVGPFRTTLDLL